MLCDSVYCPIIAHVGMFSWVVLVAFFHIQLCWNFSKTFWWSQLKNCSCLIQFTHHKHGLPHFPSVLVSSVVASFFLLFLHSIFFSWVQNKTPANTELCHLYMFWNGIHLWWTMGEGQKLALTGLTLPSHLPSLTSEENIKHPKDEPTDAPSMNCRGHCSASYSARRDFL